MADSYAKQIKPASSLVAVTPAATALTNGVCKSLYIGTAGNISITTENNETLTDIPVPQGWFYVRCTHVLVTSTNPASDIYAAYL